MAKYIEEGTNYAYTIERIENITFTELRAVAIDFTRRLPSSLTDELYKDMQHGVCQLQSEPALNMYLYSFGLMHEAKLQHAFQHLPSDFTDHEAIEIIDYGCGQAIGTICYADFLRKIGKTQKVKKVTLIEPSKRALERAALHTSCFLPEADIVTINKGFDDLVEDDLCIDEEIPTLHIFSNVLDLADDYFDLEKFAVLVNNCTRGENYFVSVSPYFDYGEKDEQPHRFFKLLDIKPYYFKISHSGEFIDGKNWTCQVIIGSSNLIGLNKIEKQPASDNKLFSKIDKQNAEVSEWYALGDNCYSQQNYSDAVNWFLKAAEHGHVEAQFKLGNCYEYGNGVPENSEAAARWYRKAAEQGHIEAQYELGLCYYCGEGVEENDKMFIRWMSKAAEQGDVSAQLHLACYYRDEGKAESVKWFRKASEQGNAEAQLGLGSLYYYGNIGAPQDYKEAFQWYYKAAEQGLAYAQYKLGGCYYEGQGVEQDYKKAINLFFKAAEQNLDEAYYILCSCYTDGNGVEQNFEEAVKWYCKTQDVGNKNKLFGLGYCLDIDKSTKQDYTEFIKLYRTAALQGEAVAQYRLGCCYYFGLGIEWNDEEAVNWFRKASERNNKQAQFLLGYNYENGIGVERDYEEAVSWYRKAAEQGYVVAQYKLGYCYHFGQGVKRDYIEAVKWYRKAAEQGNNRAQNNLGWCYYYGHGVEQNYEEAFEWLRKAAKQGHRYAQDALKKLKLR